MQIIVYPFAASLKGRRGCPFYSGATCRCAQGSYHNCHIQVYSLNTRLGAGNSSLNQSELTTSELFSSIIHEDKSGTHLIMSTNCPYWAQYLHRSFLYISWGTTAWLSISGKSLKVFSPKSSTIAHRIYFLKNTG